MLAALAVIVVSAIRRASASFTGRKSPAASRSENSESLVPAGTVLASSAAVGLAGSVVGLVSSWTNQSILIGDSFVGAVSSGLGLWSLLSMVFFGIVISIVVWGRLPKIRGLGSLTGMVAATSLIAALVVAGELSRPPSSAQALGTLNDSVTATAVVTPGAAGPNSLRVGLSGPDEEVGPVKEAVRAGRATAVLVSLELDMRSEPVPLAVDELGALYASEIVADAPGRWRVQIDLGDDGGLLILDVTLSPNPRHQK